MCGYAGTAVQNNCNSASVEPIFHDFSKTKLVSKMQANSRIFLKSRTNLKIFVFESEIFAVGKFKHRDLELPFSSNISALIVRLVSKEEGMCARRAVKTQTMH